MASLTGELQRREAAAHREVDELRGKRLSRLEITRETVTGILGGAGTDEPAAADPVPAGSRLADGSPIGW